MNTAKNTTQINTKNKVSQSKKYSVINTDTMYKIQFPQKASLGFEVLATPIEVLENIHQERESLHSRILHLQEKYESYAKQTYLDDYGIA